MGAKQGKYQGDIVNGKREGWGICAFNDRSFYEGEWKADQMDGEGKYVRPDGSVYEGYWENNLQNGFGRLTLTNGDVYEGDFRDGKMDGYGTYYYRNGSMYDGEFIEDEAHGVGTFKGVNGEFFQGEWQVDKMHGLGVYRFAGGSKFRGEFKYGRMDGYGIYEAMEQDYFKGRFEGQFLEGHMDGLGLYYWPEGDVYMGEYAQDRRKGMGVYTSAGGAVYKGDYDNGVRQGWGEFSSGNGDVYQGQWKDNERHGRGVVTLAAPDARLQSMVGDVTGDEAGGEAQRRWAEVWFKESEARPRDERGQILEIDPTRTYAGAWKNGKIKSKRPYRFDDWDRIQALSTVAAENASVTAEEVQISVTNARKSAEFSEETAKRAVQRMQDEAEEKLPFFVHLADRVHRREVEDRHMVRMGPMLTRQTFLAMLGPLKAREMRANRKDVVWIAQAAQHHALGTAHAQEAEELMSPQVVAWVQRMRRRARKDAAWHVRRPDVGPRPPHPAPAPAPAARPRRRRPGAARVTARARLQAPREEEAAEEPEGAGGALSRMPSNKSALHGFTSIASNPGSAASERRGLAPRVSKFAPGAAAPRFEDTSAQDAARMSKSTLRLAMQSIREQGEAVRGQPIGGTGNPLVGVARPPRAPKPRQLASVLEGSGVPPPPPRRAAQPAAAAPAPAAVQAGWGGAPKVPTPPRKGSSKHSDGSNGSSNGRPRWAGGVAMPPSRAQVARMTRAAH